MGTPLFQSVSPSLSTLFGSLDGHAKAGALVFCGTPGTITTRKNQKGVEYYVRRFYGGAGTQQETYLGLVGENEEQIENLRAQIAEAKAIIPELRLLVREGFQSADPKTYATLASLHLHGLFAAGATLIGSHAFGVLVNQMGIRATAYATEDVDIARREVLAFKHIPEKNFLDMLRDSGINFIEVPQLDPRQPASSFKQQGTSRFHVDLLIPSPDAEIRLVEVPELKAHATALPYLAYVLGQTQMATLISRGGCCPVRVPIAERFAIHKLVVSQLRIPRSAKTDKDIFQASVILAALGEKFPGAIETAVRDLPISAGKYLAHAVASVMDALEAHPRAAEEFENAVMQLGKRVGKKSPSTNPSSPRSDLPAEVLLAQLKGKLSMLSESLIQWTDAPFTQISGTVLAANERWAAMHTGESVQILDREIWPVEEGGAYLLDDENGNRKTERHPVTQDTQAALQLRFGLQIGAIAMEWVGRDKNW